MSQIKPIIISRFFWSTIKSSSLTTREEPYDYRISKTYVVREVWEYLLIICFGTEKLWIILWPSSFYDPMKMENDIREDMEEMFGHERKPYLQRIFGHIYIYHHKTLLHVWFSVVKVRGSADCCANCCQSGPGCGLRGSQGSNTVQGTHCTPG